MISPRVFQLRQQSLDAIPTISPERARLVTEAYREFDGLMSSPMRRALIFQYLMEHRTIYIGKGELIVGEKGPAPKATPTYPELCCHTLSDLEILDRREKIPFKVNPETRAIYEKKSSHSGGENRCANASLLRWMTIGLQPTMPASSPSLWNSAPRVTPCWTTKSTAWACSISRQRIRGQPGPAGLPPRSRSLLPKARKLKAMHIAAGALIRFAERHAELAAMMAVEEGSAAQGRAGAHRRRCAHGAGPCPAQFLGGAASTTGSCTWA